MSFVSTAPGMLSAAAADLAHLGSTIGAVNAAALSGVSGLLPAAGDEVSTAIAALFSSHGQEFQLLSAQAAGGGAFDLPGPGGAGGTGGRGGNGQGGTIPVNAGSGGTGGHGGTGGYLTDGTPGGPGSPGSPGGPATGVPDPVIGGPGGTGGTGGIPA